MNYPLYSDEYFMDIALVEARRGMEKDEVPIGAVITYDNKIIARAHNLSELLHDATAHAEMQAFTAASEAVGGKYLHDCTLFVTVEPCMMCAGAAYWTQISRIVFGACDNKKGFTLFNPRVIHPKTEVTPGVLSPECTALMTDFFKQKR